MLQSAFGDDQESLTGDLRSCGPEQCVAQPGGGSEIILVRLALRGPTRAPGVSPRIGRLRAVSNS